MKKRLILMIIFILLCLSACKKTEYITHTIYLEEAFSIIPTITIIDKKDKIESIELQNNLSKITANLDEKYNVFKEKSLINEVNKNAGFQETLVDEEFIYIISKALDVSNKTKINDKALYDISIFSIWKEWKFNENYYQYYNYSNPPSIDIIKQKLPLVNCDNIIVNDLENTIILKQEGMEIDLGSIVKGYAADKLASYLMDNDFKNCIIDVGGNIVTIGKNIITNKNFKVGVLMPYTYQTEIGHINANTNQETFVTSGIYERYIVSKNEQTNEETMYHHILNPTTGFPENNELLSVTIITTNSIEADALSTAIFLMGLTKGLEFINQSDNLSAIFITENKEIYLSNEVKNRFIVNEEIYSYGYKIC